MDPKERISLSNCPSKEEWIKEMWDKHTHTHTMQYNISKLYNKKNYHVTILMNFSGIMLSRISQAQRDKYYMTSLLFVI